MLIKWGGLRCSRCFNSSHMVFSWAPCPTLDLFWSSLHLQPSPSWSWLCTQNHCHARTGFGPVSSCEGKLQCNKRRHSVLLCAFSFVAESQMGVVVKGALTFSLIVCMLCSLLQVGYDLKGTNLSRAAQLTKIKSGLWLRPTAFMKRWFVCVSYWNNCAG